MYEPSPATLYLKRSCPHCLKLRIFLTEAGIADRFAYVVFDDGDETHKALRARMEEAGQEVVFAPLSEVADICFEGIVNDTFWITAPSAPQQQKIRDRARSQIEMTPPE